MSTGATNNTVKAITYEMLYDLLRAEKNSAKLQSIKPDFYHDCRSYFNEKKDALSKSSDNKFAQKDFLLIQEQLKNVRMLLENLYSLRIRKITSLAIDKAKLNSIVIDSSPMLDNEKKLFEEVLSTIEKHKEITILPVFDQSLELPERHVPVEPVAQQQSQQVQPLPQASQVQASRPINTESVKKANDLNEKYEETLKDHPPKDSSSKEISSKDNYSRDNSPAQKTESQKPAEIKAGFRKIEFIQAISRFYDSELNSYGPFEPGNNAELPDKIVKILIDKGAVKVLN